MPYSNIVFVKLKMELFEDPRFLIDLNDTQKGLYLMLLGLAGKTENAIRNDIGFIKKRLGLDALKEADLLKISEIYPKFTLKKGVWKFRNFEEIHNYTIGKKGKSQGNPKELPGIVQKEKEKEKKKENRKEEIKNLVSDLANGKGTNTPTLKLSARR